MSRAMVGRDHFMVSLRVQVGMAGWIGGRGEPLAKDFRWGQGTVEKSRFWEEAM